jgi:capsular polysaccharide biosynthesis protein
MALAQEPPLRGETDIGGMISIVWSEKKRLVLVALAAGVLALGVAFLFPDWFKAQAVILPPDDTDLFTNMALGQRALTKFPAFGVLGDYFTPADVFKATLLSRTVQDRVIDRFDLMKVYRLKSREKTLKELKSHYSVRLNPDGTINVSVEDRDRARAAALSMAFLEELNSYNIHNRNGRAHATREFLEQRVHETDSLLSVIEGKMKAYGELKHTMVPTGVSSGDAAAAADVMARKISLEVHLGVLRTYLREDSDEILSTKTELDQLNGRISTLPAMQSDLGRMIRDEKIQEQLFVLLTAELEQARIRERMDTPTVQILDRAYPPERHSRPKRALIAVIATVLTFLGTSIYVVTKHGRAPATG